MNELLKLAVDAHGGLTRWNQFNTIKASASITGAIWDIKSRTDVLKDICFALKTQQERLEMSFSGQNKVTVFEPKLISVKSDLHAEPIQYKNPESMFSGHELHTPWDDVHVAYFSGEALWTYLTSPFLYTYPGFITEEIEHWYENGETWRRLKVTLPDHIASHTREQISYFGPDGLIRRHDYTVDILGGATGANYATNYADVDGIIIPTTRRIYAYEDENHTVVKEPLLVAIDMSGITIG